ncbi:Amine oxidase [Pleurostoma richardsiae]|uniref:Amine oxidase n=1 Tax=Pleurostoma richardsiae TaxID=41990 RepID=A0AA38RQK7_9PEZI|nr:Amine oxidase [Pleurostoma richardsiae]
MVIRNLAVFLFFLIFFKVALSSFGYGVSISITRLERAGPALHGDSQKSCSTCSLYDAALTTKAPKPNVWAPISPEDNAAVWNWLHDPAQGLNLTLPQHAKINDNQINWIDTLHLNKSDVISFLDGSGPKPKSYARVIIYEGGKAEPVAQEYMVGPLPVDSDTKIEKLDYIYNGGMGGAVPYNARGVDAARRLALDDILAPTMADIADITSAVFSGAKYYGFNDNRSTITMNFGTPISLDGTEAHINAVFHFPGPALYLLPIDFYVMIDWTGTDTSLWSVKGFVTKERFFPSAKELRAAFEAGELEQDFQQRKDYDWALVKYQPELGERPLESRAAPQSTEIGGKRYKVDDEEKYVEYMGWSFYISHTRTLGLMFYDIRFRGERILYELSMQEAASQYGGFQPKAASTVFHDASFSLGSDVFPLVEGFDCPFGSTFWNMTFHEGNRTVVHPRAICLFEQDPGHPLSRHRAAERTSVESGAWGFENLGVVKNAELNVRFIATVGNYDYIFNYAFGLDGSLEISVRASGYLMSSPYYQDQGRFGPRVQQATQGSLHDHVITFKADFDILNSTNSLQRSELKAVPQTQPWFAKMGTFEQLELDSSVVKEEQQLNWAPNHEVMYTVVNSKATNAWGEKRGYRIIPGKSNIHLSTMKSPWSRHNMAFAKSHFAVTHQHDTEPFANSVHNANLPWKPQQDFLKFFDDENIDEEDLVVWFNLGMHHFTRAEDIPVTLFSEAVSSITFAPQNFFDRAQDGDLKNRRWIVPNDAANTLLFENYGVVLPKCHIDLNEPASEMQKIYITEP